MVRRHLRWMRLMSCGVVVSLAMAGSARAAVMTYLDYTDFDTRMSELASSAGVSAFSAPEVSTIQGTILSQLQAAYSAYTIDFTATNPGGTFETIKFGLTGPSGSALGKADQIDYRNQTATDIARVYSANFDFIVDEFSGSTSRSTQLTQLATALAGTAVHELGHNLGLRHHDCYADVEYTGLSGSVATGGSQNDHSMATGSTGLSETTGRETIRDFSVNSDVKLAFGNGLLAVTPGSTLELGDAGNAFGSAQAVSLTDLSNVDRAAANVIGFLGSNDFDYYLVDLLAGDTLTVDVNSEKLGNAADTVIDVYASDGTTVLGHNDDTFYSSSAFGNGNFRTLNSLLYNVPIDTTGAYYVRVRGWAGGSGDYELLIHADSRGVPEPATWIVMLGLFSCVGLLRRKRSRA